MEQIQKKTMPNRWGIWDWPLLIEHLEKMSLEGWLLAEYHEKTLEFVPAEPRQIKYAVTFYKDYNADGHTPPEDLVYMWQLCETDGWKNITHNNYIQIFYNEDTDAPPFHTDAEIQLENFDGMIESSLLKSWKYRALFLVLFGVFYLASRVPGLVKSVADPAQLYTLAVFLVILGAFLLYELVYSLFRWHKHRQWYKVAEVYAREENIFMAPFESPFYDKLNFAVTVVFCVCFGAAIFVLGTEDNIFGANGVLIALEAVNIFVMSRILTSMQLIKASDDGLIVPVRDRYPCSTAIGMLFVAVVLWILSYAGWKPNIF